MNGETDLVFGKVHATPRQVRDMRRTTELSLAILTCVERSDLEGLEPDALAMLTDALVGLGQVERFLAALEQEQERWAEALTRGGCPPKGGR